MSTDLRSRADSEWNNRMPYLEIQIYQPDRDAI